MNGKISASFAILELRTNGNKIKMWAQQSDNLLLKTFATEVMQAAGSGGQP